MIAPAELPSMPIRAGSTPYLRRDLGLLQPGDGGVRVLDGGGVGVVGQHAVVDRDPDDAALRELRCTVRPCWRASLL